MAACSSATVASRRRSCTPHFAAFVLLKDDAGRERLRRYYPYLELCAQTPGAGFVLETPTWRANPDWGRLLGYDAAALAQANIEAVRPVSQLRVEWRPRVAGPVVLSGVIGPRGDNPALLDGEEEQLVKALMNARRMLRGKRTPEDHAKAREAVDAAKRGSMSAGPPSRWATPIKH